MKTILIGVTFINTTSKDPEGEYLYLAPVSGVLLPHPRYQEFRIDRVTLFAVEAFLKTRRYQLMFSAKDIKESVQGSLGAEKVVAALPFKGSPSACNQECHSVLRDELNILASARLGFSKRTRKGLIAVTGCQDAYIHRGVFVGRNVDFLRRDATVITSDHLRITKEFFDIHREYGFFLGLLNLVRGGSPISSAWRSLLRDVALLVGKSQNSVEVGDAFLWNMIALDHLLLRPHEIRGQKECLVTRVKAFLGYCPLWERYELGTRIEQLYNLRCGLVHAGKREAVSIDDLIFSDEVLRNLLRGIMVNKGHFNSKSAIIEFAEKEAARDKLGLKPRDGKWRYSYVRTSYSDADYQAHWKL